MPKGFMVPCGFGCPVLVEPGTRCPAHVRDAERWRGSAAARGYDARWARFKARYISRLLLMGITPVCGARMPEAPATDDSACARRGVLNGERLHLDHIRPLTPDERHARGAAFYNERNMQLLCQSCHSVKTARDDGGFGNG